MDVIEGLPSVLSAPNNNINQHKKLSTTKVQNQGGASAIINCFQPSPANWRRHPSVSSPYRRHRCTSCSGVVQLHVPGLPSGKRKDQDSHSLPFPGGHDVPGHFYDRTAVATLVAIIGRNAHRCKAFLSHVLYADHSEDPPEFDFV